MKLRNGFVSNSSSSSFIISFDKDPKSIEDIITLLPKECYYQFYDHTVTFDHRDVAGAILEQLTNKNKLYSKKDVLAVMRGACFDSDEEDEYADTYWNENKNRHIYVVEFCDNCGELGAALEHGDFMYRMNKFGISHH